MIRLIPAIIITSLSHVFGLPVLFFSIKAYQQRPMWGVSLYFSLTLVHAVLALFFYGRVLRLRRKPIDKLIAALETPHGNPD